MTSLISMLKGYKRDVWNKCAVCGRFIAYKDFDNGATHTMVTPESEFTSEHWDTVCIKCNQVSK